MQVASTEEISQADLGRMRAIQVGMLDALAAICKRHGLRYWLKAGTLIGAVRHGGFIPWDDDIDVAMPIEDYRKFLEVAQAELQEGVFLQTMDTDPAYHYYFARLRDCDSTMLEYTEPENPGYNTGIYIDIFPEALCPPLPLWALKPLSYHIMRSSVYITSMRRRGKATPFGMLLHLLKYCSLRAIWSSLSLFKGSLIANLPEDTMPGAFWKLDDIYPLGEIKFEGKLYSAPRNIDAVLSVEYGDYMQPPPPEKRKLAHLRKLLFNTPQANGGK